MGRVLRSLWRLAKAAAVVAAVAAGLVWVSKRRAREEQAVERPVWPPVPGDELETAPAVAEVGGESATVGEAISAVDGLQAVGTPQELEVVEQETVARAAAEGVAEARAAGGAEVALAPDPVGAEGTTEDAAGIEAEPVMWVLPKDGACPDGYPVKAKLASRIYHVPGGTSYVRTTPDRCYATPADAEADGFRPAKR